MTAITSRRETVTMSEWARLRMQGAVRLGMGAAAALGAAALTAACSSSSSSPAAAPSPAASSGTAGGGSGLVITTKSGSAGAFLTDGSGRSVYLWTKDGMNSSVCSGACAAAWPPVTTTGAATASGGADKADLSTITRPDGAKQVTYDGHALYYYIGDSGPGQVNGQGSDNFGAKWWLVAPAGTSITGSVTVTSGSPGTTPSAPASPSGPPVGY
jgi:predicted lipoprotein with Yx(FWY)xxD motif